MKTAMNKAENTSVAVMTVNLGFGMDSGAFSASDLGVYIIIYKVILISTHIRTYIGTFNTLPSKTT